MSNGVKSALNSIKPSIKRQVFRPIDPTKLFKTQPPLYNNPIDINPNTHSSRWQIQEKQRRVEKERQRLNRLDDMRDRVKQLEAQGWSMKKD
ncbi:hypothetical protein [Phaffia rhodozyma]|uniref:Uncharacterized protein n=1 Tax=Phaffia rhodozyma TaxID=264483 RepID=A0A0F7SKH2_PHARH|nr:hypothetical protein [Phaffia rhodozyma]